MFKKPSTYRSISVVLFLALFVFTLCLAGVAEAYVARSSGSSAVAYGIARSQAYGYTPSQPTPSRTIPTQPTPTQPTPSQPAPLPGNISGLNAQERLLFNLVNSERASRGLKPLQLDSRLTYLARLKSQDMINHNYFAHQSPTYGSAGDMIRRAGIPFTLAAENIGVGGSVNAIFSAFMNSSGHRNKILGSRYTHTGIGIIYQPGRGYLVTQLFIQPR
ncbi:MAG TPA: CAP domain-containing protein [Bacillota bacterium]|nr:CAP domain-containing protein [Bacillota bacterium]